MDREQQQQHTSSWSSLILHVVVGIVHMKLIQNGGDVSFSRGRGGSTEAEMKMTILRERLERERVAF